MSSSERDNNSEAMDSEHRNRSNRADLNKQFPIIIEADPSKEAGGASEVSSSGENPFAAKN